MLSQLPSEISPPPGDLVLIKGMDRDGQQEGVFLSERASRRISVEKCTGLRTLRAI